MSKFTIGDRVRIIGRHAAAMKMLGWTGTVLAPHSAARNVQISADQDKRTYFLPEDALELTTAALKPTNSDQLAALRVLTEASDIEVGDKVRVLRPFPNGDFLGQSLGFTVAMNAMVGYTFVVTRKIINDRIVGFEFENGSLWPVVCLELVSKAAPAWEPITIILNEEHRAAVHEDVVKVGCQSFAFGNIEALYNAVCKAKAHKEKASQK